MLQEGPAREPPAASAPACGRTRAGRPGAPPIIGRMHLLMSFASARSDAATQVLHDLALPNLSQLLAQLTPGARDAADADTLNPPHERAYAAALGWHAADGGLPFAAHAAAADGIDTGDAAWGLVTPAHWHVGRDHVVLTDPAALRLTETESRTAFEAVRELFESEGLRMHWGAALRWYAAGAALAELPCASLDRVIGRNVEAWMRAPQTPAAPGRLIRRLQSEVQLLLYPHALNDAREARGEPTLNSFWLSGCGRAQAVAFGALGAPQLDDTLRAPLLAEDWVAWAEAWRELDAGPIAAWSAAARGGEPVALTLCGERAAQRFEAAPQTAWRRITRRFNATPVADVLGAL